MMEETQYYMAEEIAAKLRVDKETIYRHLKSGKLKGNKVGGTLWRVSQEDLDRYIKGE
jgi:excisionase family DNA binding protein